MSMPNEEHIQLLVDALRSGKYRQGRGTLANFDKRSRKVSYCCLGVACEVARANGLNVPREKFNEGPQHSYYYGDNARELPQISRLPNSVAEWYGLDRNPYLSAMTAIQANDTMLLSFRQIADEFEKAYLNDRE